MLYCKNAKLKAPSFSKYFVNELKNVICKLSF